jgi:hypothetical protein
MFPPWLEGAHAGAPLRDNSYSYFYERNWYNTLIPGPTGLWALPIRSKPPIMMTEGSIAQVLLTSGCRVKPSGFPQSHRARRLAPATGRPV